jgi:hypothetical protein
MGIFSAFKRDESLPPEYSQFIAQIKEISRLERNSGEMYGFALSVCNELYKHTGNMEWHEKLYDLVKKS